MQKRCELQQRYRVLNCIVEYVCAIHIITSAEEVVLPGVCLSVFCLLAG